MEEERKDSGVGVVEPKTLELKLPEGGFKLRTGGVLKRIDVAYEECGAIRPERDNVIFICHALTGDAHVAGIRPGETKPSGWWEGMVGPGRAIDTNRYHIVCANVLGGCSGTTGPSSINPDTGKPYGSAFPRYDFSDAVDVYRMLLEQIESGGQTYRAQGRSFSMPTGICQNPCLTCIALNCLCNCCCGGMRFL